jgi:hypothetical protein
MKHNCRQHCCCNLIHRKWQERTCAQFDERNAILFIPLKLLEVHVNKITEFHSSLVTGLCALWLWLWQSAGCWKSRFLKGLRYRVFILLYNYLLLLPFCRINTTHSTERPPAPHSSNDKQQLPDKLRTLYKQLRHLHAGPSSIYFVNFPLYTHKLVPQ